MMPFDARNSSWYFDLDKKSKGVLRNSRPSVDRRSEGFKAFQRTRLIMDITDRLLDPVEGCCFEYLEQNVSKLARSQEKESRDQGKQEVKEDVKRAIREKFMLNFKRAFAIGLGNDVHNAVYEAYRNKKNNTFQREIYVMIQNIASELIMEFYRERKAEEKMKGNQNIAK